MGAELRRLNRLKFFRLCTSVKGTENWHKDKDKTERHADDLFYRHLFQYTNYSFEQTATDLKVTETSLLRSTQPSIPPGSVNEYQLRLGRQR